MYRNKFTSIIPPPEMFLDSLQRSPAVAPPDSAIGKSKYSSQLDTEDPVAMHLLVETALGDSQDYEVLSFEEVEALKKESRVVQSRIEALARKLTLETKFRDAAQSLNRLNNRNNRGGETPKNRRRSIGSRSSGGSVKDAAVAKSEAEFAASARKCEELTMELWQLESRSRRIQMQLLRHTAGVLQVTHEGPSKKKDGMRSILPDGMTRGRPDSPASLDNYEMTRSKTLFSPEEGFDERSLYKSPENIDLLLGSKKRNMSQGLGISAMPMPQPVVDNEARETLLTVESRLEELNKSLRGMIMKSNPSRYPDYPAAPNALNAQGNWVVQEQLDFLDKGLRSLETEQATLLTEQGSAQQRIKQARSELEGRLEAINNQVANLIENSQAPGSEQYPPPPPISGQGSQDQIVYLDEALYTMQQLNEALIQDLAKARSQAEKSSQSTQNEAVLTGLWTIILSEEEDRRQRKQQRRQMLADNPDGEREEDLSPDEDGAVNEPFSIETFSRKVQWLVTRASNLKDQQSILRRQIKQQRDLNNKADTQREEEVANLNQQIKLAREQHADAEQELTKVLDEVSRLQMADQQRGAQSSEAVVAEQKRRQEAEQRILALEDSLRAASSVRETSEARAKEIEDTMQAKDKELRDLEGEVVRLTTEVTIARAELDGAYGSRSQRAAEIDSNPEVKKRFEELNTRNQSLAAELEALRVAKSASETRTGKLSGIEKQLKDELASMAIEYEQLTQDSIQMEKDRERYEAVIDGLRNEREKLELELSDEKMRWLGVKSPGQQQQMQGPEMTSVRMMRDDFRRIMREKTSEALKALRVCIPSSFVDASSANISFRPSKKSEGSWRLSSDSLRRKTKITANYLLANWPGHEVTGCSRCSTRPDVALIFRKTIS